jgi:sulfur carrier protein
MSFTLILNGQSRDFARLTPPVTLAQLITDLELKGDRIAVEHNDEIVERSRWPMTDLSTGDRLEVVHFVGGGSCLRRLYIISVIGHYVSKPVLRFVIDSESPSDAERWPSG